MFTGTGTAESYTIANAFTALDLIDAADIDNGSIHDATNERLLARRAARWAMALTFRVDALAANSTLAADFAKNGVAHSPVAGYFQEKTNGSDRAPEMSGLVTVTAGDYIGFRLYKSDANNRNVSISAVSVNEVFA